MDASNNSREIVIQEGLSRAFEDGWYSKPHGVMRLLQSKYLSKSEYVLMDFLFAFENRHWKTNADGWFWCADKTIRATGMLSSKSIVQARRGLVEEMAL